MKGMEKKGKGRGAVKRIKRWWEAGRKREKKKGKGRGAVWEDDERQRKERGGVNCTLGLGFFLFILSFFLNAGMVEPVRFGSVQSVSDFGNRNRTEPGFFLTILIGLIGFFFG